MRVFTVLIPDVLLKYLLDKLLLHTTSLLTQSTKSTLNFLFGIRSSLAMNAPLCIFYTKKLSSTSDN